MRRRGHFEESGQTALPEELNKYDEKYMLPTDGAFGFGTAPEQVTVQPTQPVMAVNDGTFGFAPEQGASRSNNTSQPVTPVGERPMVFALRSDSSLFVYEYSDRLEIYRNTGAGMKLCNVDYKNR